MKADIQTFVILSIPFLFVSRFIAFFIFRRSSGLGFHLTLSQDNANMRWSDCFCLAGDRRVNCICFFVFAELRALFLFLSGIHFALPLPTSQSVLCTYSCYHLFYFVEICLFFSVILWFCSHFSRFPFSLPLFFP